MKKLMNKIMLSLVVSAVAPQVAMANGASAPKESKPNPVLDVGLDLAITYAKLTPRYAVVLNALNIYKAQDLKTFAANVSSGKSFRNIVGHLAFQSAQANASTAAILARLGLTSEQSLRTFLDSLSGGAALEQVLNIALLQATSNAQYSVWLTRMNIHSVQDIKNLMTGRGLQSNLTKLVLSMGLSYAQSNAKLAIYVPVIQAVLTAYGYSIDVNSPVDIGPFNGMTVGEVTAVQLIN